MASQAPSCFQCGLPASPAISAEIAGELRAFCCSGCRLAAELIAGHDLGAYYARREGFGRRPEKSDFPFDDSGFVEGISTAFGCEREVQLSLEGLHCAACVWLIERVLGRTAGVLEARVNLTASRLSLRWQPERIQLGELTGLLSALGYPCAPYDPTGSDRKARKHNRDLIRRLGVGALSALGAMFLGDPLNLGGFDVTELHLRSLLVWTDVLISTPAMLYVGWLFFRGAWTGLKARTLTMDATITLATAVAYGASLWAVVTGQGAVYFDCVLSLLFFLLLGRLIEGIARRKVFAQAEGHWRLESPTATLLDGDAERSVPTSAIRHGDRLLVRPGERIPVDGIVLTGTGHVDESLLSGESVPVTKTPGSLVTGGTVNLDGALSVGATRVGSETTLAQIVRWVREADAARAPSQRFADRVASIFLPVLIGIAGLTFYVNLAHGLDAAIRNTVSVLIVTCPCALGLATPAAIAIAMARAAREGILFKGGEELEGLSRVRHVVFDKTGTLTSGKMRVREVRPAPGVEASAVLELAASLETLSEHPLARAIAAEGKRLNVSTRAVEAFKANPGHGVEGRIEGHAVALGSITWLGGTRPEELLPDEQDATTVYVAQADRLIGAIDVADTVRPEAAATVAALRDRGVEVMLLSGDRRPTVEAVAHRLGIERVRAEATPDEKRAALLELARQPGGAAMVGDGVNDAPALAVASIGVAMGQRAAISASAAGVVLLGDHLSQLLAAIRLSEDTLRTIRSNFVISALYNLLVVPIAATGHVAPQWAAVLMPLSSLLVLGNSLRLGRTR